MKLGLSKGNTIKQRISLDNKIKQGIGIKLKLQLAPRNYVVVEGALEDPVRKPPTIEELARYISQNIPIVAECVEDQSEPTLAEKVTELWEANGLPVDASQQYEWLRKILRDQTLQSAPPKKASILGNRIYTFYVFWSDDMTNEQPRIEIPKTGFVEIPKSIIGHKYVEASSLNDALGSLMRLYSKVNTGNSTLTVNISDKRMNHIETWIFRNEYNRCRGKNSTVEIMRY